MSTNLDATHIHLWPSAFACEAGKGDGPTLMASDVENRRCTPRHENEDEGAPTMTPGRWWMWVVATPDDSTMPTRSASHVRAPPPGPSAFRPSILPYVPIGTAPYRTVPHRAVAYLTVPA
ncbi:uncharacterized protein PSFLO_06364 [Pseudozyma flocculosa]|uniref:Uncharacterized protein n=1 Tax=Pseudozyma flocculosa TaxID=84751 RepID=A0A5C3F8Z5_9BASI|nr:uncharacterized protein PSFLO_06364 [Pseudozyma flocculosa]